MFGTHLFVGGAVDGQQISVLRSVDHAIMPDGPACMLPAGNPIRQDNDYERVALQDCTGVRIEIFVTRDVLNEGVIARLVAGYKA